MTSDFLARIINQKKARIAEIIQPRALNNLREAAHGARSTLTPHAFHDALKLTAKPFNIIAEYKRASPSKGVIREDVTVEDVARDYEQGGACAMSVLTEGDFFKGSLGDLVKVKNMISLPVLRKDFTIHESQIYEAAAAGADAVLLIVAALTEKELSSFRRIAEQELNMDALIEVHTREELTRAVSAQANIIGINNRDLHSFNVTLETSLELIKYAPKQALMISESGLTSPDDLQGLKDAGFDAFLIGETLMRADDAKAELKRWLQ